MRIHMTVSELKTRAEKALTTMLGQMSGVNVTGMQRASMGNGQPGAILAHVEVFGHHHILICGVEPDGEPARVRASLRTFTELTASSTENTRTLIFVPHLSQDVLRLCNEADVGFLDLEGNARLSVGEVFIDIRVVSCRASERALTLPVNGKVRIVPRHDGGWQSKSLTAGRDRSAGVGLKGSSCTKAFLSKSDAPGAGCSA